MEERKQKEITYYDAHAKKMLERGNFQGDFEGSDHLAFRSYKFCYQLLQKYCKGKRVLDYGCGNGIHSIFPARHGAHVVGIDFSEVSLSLARERAEMAGVRDRIEFFNRDCEDTGFPDNSFNIVFDGGTFSSLDLGKALAELARVLRHDGILIGIETLGHNPFLNMKRSLNARIGIRTQWAARHIVRMEDIEMMKKYFGRIDCYFFHLISWIAFPLIRLPGGRVLLHLLEQMERFLFLIPWLRKYAFKIVFICSQLKK